MRLDGLARRVMTLVALGSAACSDAGRDSAADAAADAALPVPDGGADPDPADSGPEPDAAFGCGDRSGGFELNDVSFLFPLPASPEDRDDLLAMSDSGERGELLPAALFDDLPAPLSRFRDIAFADLHVVAARVDPCFAARAGEPCRSQLRLVVQPLRPDIEETRADDAAIHLFYDQDEAGFAALLGHLHELRALAGERTRCRPLAVHPVLQAEGLRGPYAARLEQAILASAGATNLVRVAVMQLQQPGSVWRFSAFDLAGGALQPVPIPRTAGRESQSFSLSDTEVHAAFLDPPPESSLIPLLFDPTALPAASPATRAAAAAETFTIENPDRRDTTDTDCVSCHVSRRALDNARAIVDLDADPSTAYTNPAHDLSLPDDRIGIGSQRAFGYFDGAPSVTPRTIHETARVADALSKIRD